MTMAALPTPEPERTTLGEPVLVSAAQEKFFSAAIPRMVRLVVVFGAIFTAIAHLRFGYVSGLGVAVGALLSYLGFRSLNRGVRSLMNRVENAGRSSGIFSLVNAFFLRNLLAAVVAYGIFTSSPRAFRGFLFGLCTPVAAMVAEAGYEAYGALRRGF